MFLIGQVARLVPRPEAPRGDGDPVASDLVQLVCLDRGDEVPVDAGLCPRNDLLDPLLLAARADRLNVGVKLRRDRRFVPGAKCGEQPLDDFGIRGRLDGAWPFSRRGSS